MEEVDKYLGSKGFAVSKKIRLEKNSKKVGLGHRKGRGWEMIGKTAGKLKDPGTDYRIPFKDIIDPKKNSQETYEGTKRHCSLEKKNETTVKTEISMGK